jgi:NADPH:quinone reductase-like Zn-dependent oxidoreductase
MDRPRKGTHTLNASAAYVSTAFLETTTDDATQSKAKYSTALDMEELQMSGKLNGKIAVITGGNSGIGLATAKRFVAEGAYVFITGRRQAELNAAVKEVGKNVTAVQGDVAKLSDLDRLYDIVKRTTGQVDIVFANAGVAWPSSLLLEKSRNSTSTRSSASMSKAWSSLCKRLCP